MRKPKSIKVKSGNLLLLWEDTSFQVLALKTVRDSCPCAGCKGETILWNHYAPASPPDIHPEMYSVAAIVPVGDYAVQINWKDGHQTGIYSYDFLESIARKDNSDGEAE